MNFVNFYDLPAPALAKLLALDDAVKQLTEKDASLSAQIEDRRARLNGRIIDQRDDHARLHQDLEQLLADQKTTKAHLRDAESLLASCKTWIERLPPQAKLEVVAPPSSVGKDLAKVRADLNHLRDELARIKSAPTPSPDLRQRVERYVDRLGAPIVRGIGEGEVLRIIWPGARQTTSGPDEKTADVLSLFAILFREKMVSAIMDEATRMANQLVPLAEWPKRIADLAHQIEQLSRVEEALIERALAAGESVHRSASAPPVAVLGVKLVEARKHVA